MGSGGSDCRGAAGCGAVGILGGLGGEADDGLPEPEFGKHLDDDGVSERDPGDRDGVWWRRRRCGGGVGGGERISDYLFPQSGWIGSNGIASV